MNAPTCPVCGASRIRRHGRALLTCGDRACGYELRGRRTRGNVYGDTGGGPIPSTDVSYGAVHTRARLALRGLPCAMADDTCSGRLEASLREDAPKEWLRVDPDTGRKFFSGLDARDGYQRLCASHHRREDLRRLGGPRRQYVRQTHCKRGHEFTSENIYEPSPGRRNCRTCRRLAGRRYVARQNATQANKDGLTLPWTGQAAS